MIKPDSSDIQTNLYEHSWTIKNKEFADKLLERILPEKGFIGKKFVNYNIENMIIEMIVKHFKEKGITIPINDFTGHLHASDRGF